MYISKPKRSRKGGVLVIHSWWGFNDFFRKLCDDFSEAGFVALGADLFQGKVARSVSEAKELRARTTASRKEPAYKYLIRMIDDLREEANTENIAVVGFSMGGHWAYWLAQQSKLPIVATVTFYSARNGDYSNSKSSFLGHFAETGEWVSRSSKRKLESSLSAAGRPYEFWTYENTGHWFFEKDRKDAYNQEAAELAWTRTVRFLENKNA